MKKLIALFIIAAIFIGIIISPIGVLAQERVKIALTPCEQPITYRIDEVDPQFHISKSAFTEKVQVGAALWNDAYGKEIFKYDPEGRVEINLTFDGRQAINEQVNELENNLKSKKGSLDTKQAEFEQQVKQHNADSQAFDVRAKKLSDDVDYWKQRGGAPENEYKKLLEEQASLRLEASRLNEIAQQLNAVKNGLGESVSEFNSELKQLDNSIDTFNEAIHQKPEEGVFNERELRIDIFFNTNEDTLIRTVAHELGHSRGLDHVKNENAVMYEKTFPEYTLTPEDLTELTNACRKRTPQEAFVESIRNIALDLRRA